MPCEQKADRSTQDECFRIGAQIQELRVRQNKLRNEVSTAESLVAEVRLRISEIVQEISNIQFAEDSARAAGSRGGVPGAIVGEVTAGAIRLAMQRDRLERERDQWQSRLSNLEHTLNGYIRRLEEVGYLLGNLHDAFERRGCSASSIPF